jgi:L-fuculose-phosphate aldolase
MTGVGTGFSAAERDALVEGSRAIAHSGMIVGSAGNLSIRAGDRLLITPRGAELGDVDPVDMVDVSLTDGSVSEDHASRSRPSSETPLHRAIYDACQAQAIVHTHAHYATVLSTLVGELPAIHYMITAFGGPVRVARYETFGTEALAAAVTEALEGRSAALMANHGAVATGANLRRAVQNALLLEWLASVYYHALCAGSPTILSTPQLDQVVKQIDAFKPGHHGASS